MRPPIALVSHLASPHQVTGAEQSLLHLAAGLSARGHRLRWYSPAPGRSVDEAARLGIETEVLAWPRLFLASYRASAAGTLLRAGRFALGAPQLLRLSARLRDGGARVALVNTLVNAGAVWAAKRAGLAVAWRVAELPGPGSRRGLWRRLGQRLAVPRVAVSRAVAAAVGPEGVRVVPSGVACPSADDVTRAREDLRDRLGLGRDALLLGHVGQIRPHKGQLELVAALRELPRLDATAVVIGAEEGDRRYAHHVRAAAASLGDRVRFAGYVGGAGRAAAAVDVLAFTALDPDPFPLVVLEAMMAGVPVVAFDAGGVPEAIDRDCGRLVPPSDLAALGRALGELLGSSELRGRLGAAAAQRARESFSIARCVAGYAEVLDQVADEVGYRD